MRLVEFTDQARVTYPAVVVDSLLVSKGHPRATFEEAWQVAMEFCPPPDSWGRLSDPDSPLAFLRDHCERAWDGERPSVPGLGAVVVTQLRLWVERAAA